MGAHSRRIAGLGDAHTHDAQIGLFIRGYNPDLWRDCLRMDPTEFFDDPDVALGPDADRAGQPGEAP